MRRTNPGMIGKAKLNTIKITVALVGAFLACWTPYYVMCIWFWADPEQFEQIDYSIRKFLFIFACTNSCANPLIYGVFADRKASIFNSRERLYFLPNGRKKKWNNPHARTDQMKMKWNQKYIVQKKNVDPKVVPILPNIFINPTKPTIFQTEFRYHERSFHGKTTRYESNLCRRSISTPNFSQMKIDDCGLVTEVHLKTNDITLKVIQAPENMYS